MRPKALEVLSHTLEFLELQAVSWFSLLVYVSNHYKVGFTDQTWNTRQESTSTGTTLQRPTESETPFDRSDMIYPAP